MSDRARRSKQALLEEIAQLERRLEEAFSAEEALQDSERRLRFLYENVHEVIFYLDVEGPDRYRFESVNPAFCRATGLPAEAVVGRLVHEVIPEPSLSLVLSKYREAIERRTTVHWEEITPYPAGTKVGDVALTPIFDDSGACTNLIGTVSDVTERKRVEDEVRVLNVALEERVAERTRQLEASNRELEAFSYSVSHDLRAPLRAIDGFVRILMDDYAPALDEEGRRICGVIRDNAGRMGQLIDDLLTFSRLGRTELQPSRVDMQALAQAVFQEITTPADRARIDFRAEGLPCVTGDPALLRQVWTNLLGNAVKFSGKREQALVTVRGETTAGEAVFIVQDNGAGFDMRYVSKLFGVFQRLHSTREFEGTGVGLAIVQRVLHRHGGRAWAEGKIDRGATFYFALPTEGK